MGPGSKVRIYKQIRGKNFDLACEVVEVIGRHHCKIKYTHPLDKEEVVIKVKRDVIRVT